MSIVFCIAGILLVIVLMSLGAVLSVDFRKVLRVTWSMVWGVVRRVPRCVWYGIKKAAAGQVYICHNVNCGYTGPANKKAKAGGCLLVVCFFAAFTPGVILVVCFPLAGVVCLLIGAAAFGVFYSAMSGYHHVCPRCGIKFD